MGRRIALIGITILFCSGIFGTIVVQAKNTTTEFDFVYGGIFDDPERMWVSEDGVWHLRNSFHYYSVISSSGADFEGDFIYLANLNLFDDLMDPTTFNSVGWGSVEFTGTLDGNDIGFAGIGTLKIHDFFITGKMVCHGSGGLGGMLVKITFEGILGGPYNGHMVIH